MKRYSIFLPELMISKLKDLANRTGISLSEHVRRAIDDYLRREGKKDRH